MKAIKGKVKWQVKCKNVEAKESHAGDDVLLEVHQNTRGMPPQVMMFF